MSLPAPRDRAAASTVVALVLGVLGVFLGLFGVVGLFLAMRAHRRAQAGLASSRLVVPALAATGTSTALWLAGLLVVAFLRLSA